MIFPALFLLLLSNPVPAVPACLPVQGDHIQARHLGAVFPEFNQLDPETTIFLAPVPGVLRFVRPDEIRHVAKAQGIVSEANESVCFSVPLEPIGVDRIVLAMRQEMGKPQAGVEVLDYSKSPVPEGKLVFPRSGLSPPPNQDIHAVLTWRGYVQYTPQRRLPVWAKVRLSVLSPRVVAVSAIRSGTVVLPGQVRLEQMRVFPFQTDAVETIGEVAGMIAHKEMVPGVVVLRSWLTSPVLIEKGETITVESRVGAARLVLKANAETSGRLGGAILVRNPAGGRSFQAKVVGPGRAEVNTSTYASAMQTQNGRLKQ